MVNTTEIDKQDEIEVREVIERDWSTIQELARQRKAALDAFDAEFLS